MEGYNDGAGVGWRSRSTMNPTRLSLPKGTEKTQLGEQLPEALRPPYSRGYNSAAFSDVSDHSEEPFFGGHLPLLGDRQQVDVYYEDTVAADNCASELPSQSEERGADTITPRDYGSFGQSNIPALSMLR